MGIEELQELQDKLSKEANQLVNNIMNLEDILFSRRETEKITRTQFNLLDIQLNSMKTYYRVLRARIEDFEYEIRKLKNKSN